MAQQARAIQTRRVILVAAASVFDERGYASATISEILARAGVTKGALYFHFSSKEELALGVMGLQLEYGPALPQLTKLQDVVDQGMLLAHRLRHEPIARASVALAMDQAIEGLDRGTPFRAWIDRLSSLLNEAKAQGELLPHVNPVETAELLAGAFTGIQELSQIICLREDVEHRISVLLHHVLPSVALPAVLASLDMADDRAARLFADFEPQDPLDDELIEAKSNRAVGIH